MPIASKTEKSAIYLHPKHKKALIIKDSIYDYILHNRIHKKSAEKFFELLKNNGIKTLVDVRISNSSQLAGFAKGKDLEYFTKQICGANYKHIVDFAPTKEFWRMLRSNSSIWLL